MMSLQRQHPGSTTADPQVNPQLAGRPSVRVGYLRSTEPPSTADVLCQLAQDKSRRVRRVLAGQDGLPSEAARHLASDASSLVRSLLAAATSHLEVLAILLDDPNADVRAAAVRNVRTTPAQLTRAALDPKAAVRHAVVWHHAVPAETLHSLGRDRVQHVRSHARYRLKNQQSAATSTPPRARVSITAAGSPA